MCTLKVPTLFPILDPSIIVVDQKSTTQAGQGIQLPAHLRATLESGVDVNKGLTQDKRTALYVAAQHGQVAVVKALIEAEADVNKTGGDKSALIFAVAQGQASCVVELIKAGADVNLASNDISTPLAEAIIYGHDAIAGMLILAGADVGKEHGLFIALAELYKQVNIVKLLKQFGA